MLLTLTKSGKPASWGRYSWAKVVSPTPEGFRKLRVPLEKLPVLQKLSQKQRQEFEIDEEGTFLYWPGGDIHLGWEQFEYAVDKAASLKAKQQTEAFNKAYGSAIRKLRREKSLRQSDIEGLTPRQVGRIESGQRGHSVGTSETRRTARHECQRVHGGTRQTPGRKNMRGSATVTSPERSDRR